MSLTLSANLAISSRLICFLMMISKIVVGFEGRQRFKASRRLAYSGVFALIDSPVLYVHTQPDLQSHTVSHRCSNKCASQLASRHAGVCVLAENASEWRMCPRFT